MHKKYLIIALLLSLVLLLWACAKPEAQSEAGYSYTLTKEQAQNYQSAACYLLKREGENLYYVQYSGLDVTFSDGKLSTQYDGKGVRITDDSGEQIYLALDLNSAGDKKQFLGTAVLTDWQNDLSSWRYLLQVDSQQSKPTIVAMRPFESGTDEELLAGKYTDLPEKEQYKQVFFNNGIHYNLAYGEDGKLLPPSQWTVTDYLGAYEINMANELEIDYAPLVGGDYYLLYRITDQQGNTYCSDLIPYKTEPAPAERKPEPEVTVKWAKGERQQLLLEDQGIEVYLSVEKNWAGDSVYALKVKNNTSAAIYCHAGDVFANGIVPFAYGGSVTVEPGQFVAGSGFSFGIAEGSPELEQLASLQLTLKVMDSETEKTIIQPRTILVDMTEAWPANKGNSAYFQITEPAMDALAKEQVLLENDVLRITLVAAGKLDTSYSDDLTMTLKIENLSQRSQPVSITGAAVNGIFEKITCSETVPAGCTIYTSGKISQSSVKVYGGDSIETLSLLVETNGQEDWTVRSVQQQWVPVVLEQAGTASPFEIGTVLYEKDGLVIGCQGYNALEGAWLLTLSNGSAQGVTLHIVDAQTGKTQYFKPKADANQKACFEVEDPAPGDAGQIDIQIKVYDFAGKNLLNTIETITLQRK